MADMGYDFWKAQEDWSEKTFGTSSVRGPLGPLKHLKKEIETELIPNIEKGIHDPEEYCDLLFLIFDAARRSGMSYMDLIIGAFKKLSKNKARTWPDWRTLTDHTNPVEHDRSKD